MEAEPNSEANFHVEGGEHGRARASRLRQAIALVGSVRAASELSEVPFGTIQRYLSGGEMKLSNAVALARATGVRLAWLATGEGPMKPAAAPSPPPSASRENPGMAELSDDSAAPIGLAWQANPDRLARAYDQALAGLVVPAGQRPDSRRLMQFTLLLYDHLTEVETPPPPPA